MSPHPLICEPFLLSQQSSGLLKHVTQFHGTCEDKAYPGPRAPAPAVTQQVSGQLASNTCSPTGLYPDRCQTCWQNRAHRRSPEQGFYPIRGEGVFCKTLISRLPTELRPDRCEAMAQSTSGGEEVCVTDTPHFIFPKLCLRERFSVKPDVRVRQM